MQGDALQNKISCDIVFLCRQLRYLKEYLTPKDKKKLTDLINSEETSISAKDKARKILRMNNFSEEITLLAYCLMPNHFHFFLKQNNSNSIDKFMNSLGTRYTMYFNKKYKRVGKLYEGTYKAVIINNEEYFLYLSKYIHRQSLPVQGDLHRQPSSYLDYLRKRETEWIKPEETLSFFSKNNSSLTYRSFVEENMENYLPSELQIERDFGCARRRLAQPKLRDSYKNYEGEE